VRRSPGLLPVATLLVLLAACSSSRAGPVVVRNIQDPGHGHGTYFVTAIDYHFHDAHPTVPLTRDRRLVIVNEGSNLHNVTIVGTDFSRDVRPGHHIAIRRIDSLFAKPGRYPFFCSYHVDRGMKGVIVVR
jgi:hypothetical protein